MFNKNLLASTILKYFSSLITISIRHYSQIVCLNLQRCNIENLSQRFSQMTNIQNYNNNFYVT